MKGRDLLLFGLLTFTTVAVVGFYYYSINIFQKETYSDQQIKEKERTVTPEYDEEGNIIETFTETSKLERLVINLPSRSGRLRFLELEMTIEPIDGVLIEDIEKHHIYIKDIAIEVAGQMKPSELNSISGKILLEERIKKRFRKITPRNLISRIYYQKFIVQ